MTARADESATVRSRPRRRNVCVERAVAVDLSPATASRTAGEQGLVSAWAAAVVAGETSPLLRDWVRWLTLSRTPSYTAGSEPLRVLRVRRGVVADPLEWPVGRLPRIYAVFDDSEAVYVGQTCQPFLKRVRGHFGNQSTLDQREKAGTWDFVVSVAFDDLRHGQLGRLEADAAGWILPPRRTAGRRHPR